MRHDAINYILVFTTYLLAIIPTAATCTITYFAVMRSLTDDEEQQHLMAKRIKATLKLAIILESLTGLIAVFKAFFPMQDL